MDLVDVDRGHPGLEQQLGADRDDVQQGLAGLDHTARRRDLQIDHGARPPVP